MRRRALLAPVLCAVAVITVVVLSRLPTGPRSDAVRSATGGKAPPNSQDPSPEARSEKERSGTLLRDPAGRMPGARAATPFVDEGPPGHFRVDGTIRRRDGSLWVSSGEIRVSGDADSDTSSEVIDGRFRLWIRRAAEYWITLLVLDDEAYGGVLAPRDLVEGTTWDVVVEPLRSVTITVLDDATGAPVSAAVAISSAWRGPDPVPGHETPLTFRPVHESAPADRLHGAPLLSLPRMEDLTASAQRADARGRITLPPTWAPWVVATVGAPGHAWSSVPIDLDSRDAPTVRLGPGGTIEVTVRPPRALPGFRVVTIPSDGPLVEVALDADGHGAQDGIASGASTVSVIDDSRDAVVSRSVVIVTGERTIVALDLPETEVAQEPAAAQAPRVTLRGVFHLPAAWVDDDDQFTLQVNLRGAERASATEHRMLAMPRRESTAYAFSLDDVALGRYDVSVVGIPWAGTLEVGPSGAPVKIEVPAPTHLVVRFVDATDRAPIAGVYADWIPRLGDAEGTSGRSGTDGAATVRVPEAMAGYLCVRAWGYLAPYEETGDPLRPVGLPVAGATPANRADPLVIPLQRAARIRVRAVGARGEAIDAWPSNGRPTLWAAGEEASGLARAASFPKSLSGREFEFSVPAGKWTLECDLPSEFEPFPSQKIESHVGETTEIQVRLVPRK